MKARQAWRDLSVSKKLYIVVGVMSLLIAIELISLSFAMNTLSSVRAFVGGEGLWSKAQKNAVLNLQKYSLTKDPVYFHAYKQSLEIPTGDRQARIEMEKPDPDYEVIYQGFLKGKIDYNDIDGLIKLVRRFHNVPQLRKALIIWSEGDRMLSQLIELADQLHAKVLANASKKELADHMLKIDDLDAQLTMLENNFSYALGEGSRWLENVLLTILFLAVLTVESTGLWLTISFSRNLSRGLKELSATTAEIGKGDFSKRLPVHSRDELGQLALSLNTMTETLQNSVGGRDKAEKASEVKSMFLANMSHEIRTPLGAMLGFAELLRDRALTQTQREQYIDIILRTGNSLSKILHDILDISKVEAGQIEIEKSNCTLVDVLIEIRDIMTIKCADKGLKLIIETDNHTPPIIFTDVIRLRQILMNLIGNAIKFTDHGHIRLHTRVEGAHILFEVTDTGIGLSDEQSKKLFQAFSQTGSQERKAEGSGLGLILSRHLAELLGGTVSLTRSAPGKGSTFTASILLEKPPALDLEHPDTHPAVVAVEKFLQGRHFLIVDDALENRLLIEKLLEKRGATVDLAVNGQDGIEKAKSANYDAILMDVQMPLMDGYEAVKHLRQQGYSKPIIALTAQAMKGDRLKCLEAGYSDYLTKPLQTTEFLLVVSRHLGSHIGHNIDPQKKT